MEHENGGVINTITQIQAVVADDYGQVQSKAVKSCKQISRNLDELVVVVDFNRRIIY